MEGAEIWLNRGTGFVDTGVKLLSIDLPDMTRGQNERTNAKSGRWKEYSFGSLRDAGEIGFSFEYDQPSEVGIFLQSMVEDNKPIGLRVVMPDDIDGAAGENFDMTGGFISVSFSDTPMDGVRKISVKFKVSGKPAFVDAVVA